MLGRGVALGLSHAQHLRDLLGEIGPYDAGFVVEYDRRISPEVDAWYADTVGWDRSRLDGIRSVISGDTLTAHLRSQFLHAAQYDPMLYRAFLRVLNTFDPSAQVFADPALLARVAELVPTLPPLDPVAFSPWGERLCGTARVVRPSCPIEPVDHVSRPAMQWSSQAYGSSLRWTRSVCHSAIRV